MNLLNPIEENNSSVWENFNDFSEDFFRAKKEENRKEFERLVQSSIESIEIGQKVCVKRASKMYFTMFR